MRNAGDCIAQAAASCRFKTGTELVIDELREAATCLQEGVVKLKLAVEEAEQDERMELARAVEACVIHLQECGQALESAGAAIMKGQEEVAVGVQLVEGGTALQLLSPLIGDVW